MTSWRVRQVWLGWRVELVRDGEPVVPVSWHLRLHRAMAVARAGASRRVIA